MKGSHFKAIGFTIGTLGFIAGIIYAIVTEVFWFFLICLLSSAFAAIIFIWMGEILEKLENMDEDHRLWTDLIMKKIDSMDQKPKRNSGFKSLTADIRHISGLPYPTGAFIKAHMSEDRLAFFCGSESTIIQRENILAFLCVKPSEFDEIEGVEKEKLNNSCVYTVVKYWDETAAALIVLDTINDRKAVEEYRQFFNRSQHRTNQKE